MASTRIDDLRGRLAKDPGSRLFAQLAEELRKEGALVEAIGVSRDGLARHPTYTSARLTLGRCLLETGNLKGAIAELQAAAAGAPDNILAVRLLAESHEKAGAFAVAAEHYRSALRLAPGDKQLSAQLEAAAARATAAPPSVSAAPSAPPQDLPPIPVLDIDPSETFELEGPAGRPYGAVEPSPPPSSTQVPEARPLLERPIEFEGEDDAPQTLRLKPNPGAAQPGVAEPPSVSVPPPLPPPPAAAPAPPPPSAAPQAAAPELASVTLVELYRSQGALDKAIDTCTEVLRRDPLNAKARGLRDELLAQARQAVTAPSPADRRAALEGAIQRLEGFLAVVKRG